LFAEEKGATASSGPAEPDKILDSAVDATEWQAEAVRVGPKLRSRTAHMARSREWLAHLEEANASRAALSKELPEARAALERVGADAAAALERVSAKEKFLNTTFGGHTDSFRSAQAQLRTARERSGQVGQRVADLSARAAALADAIEESRSQMESGGTSVEDTSPLVRIKAALQRLRAEMRTMDLRAGVLGHTLLQAKVVRGGTATSKKMHVVDDDDDELDLSNDEHATSGVFSP
jgi:estrogen-related receptor beta like 1